MSAFIIGNKSITGMLQAATPHYPGDGASYYWDGERHYFGGHHQEIGQKLADENYRSVNHRYNGKDEPETYKALACRVLTPIEIIKVCHCYDYQACETPTWKESEAFAISKALQGRAIRMSPGYDDAPWGL